MKDWTENSKSVFTTLGASSHSLGDREQYDYYATEPKAIKLLLELETFNANVWECACGEGHISEVLKANGYSVYSSDLINRGYGEVRDFLSIENQNWSGDIITNPPYRYAEEFLNKALSIINEGNKIAMLLRLQFLEGKARRRLHDSVPPIRVYVASSRISCAKNGNFKDNGGGALCYAWFIWQKGYSGETILKWFN